MPDKVHCCHILVKTETEAKAAKTRLEKGEKFGAVAQQVSLCSSSKKGGDLGTFPRGKMAKEFEKAAFELEKGQTSAPVKTKFGYHIIKRIE
jgi:parvulin-like peptidyl-prolyl isomerase